LHYVIVGLGQCFDTAYVTTYSKPLPVINAYYDTTIYLGQSVQIFSQASNAVTWTPTNDLSCSNCNNPIASPKETTRYCASTTENGCIDTSCVTVIVDLTCGDIFMPSAFSPNGDGENDCYQPLGNCIDEVLFRIYSRWGEVIFETTDKNACWDGSFKGKDLNTGVYTYTVSAKLYNGEEVELKGNVSLFR
jgi:gliding motility-associated-like protein